MQNKIETYFKNKIASIKLITLLIIKIKSWFNKDIIFYKQNIKIKIYFNNYKIVQKFILNDW